MTLVPVEEDHYAIYNARMAAGMEDKLFFAERLDAKIIVDFGCADGTLLRHLADRDPYVRLIGFDASEIELARAARVVPRATLFNDWDKMLAHLEQYRGQRIALVASSVIHEVYAYGGTDEGDLFWWRVANGPFTDFVLRDMAVSNNDAAHLRETPDLGHALRTGPAAMLAADYETRWGSLDHRWHAVHFMLKYRYTDNWRHELDELYLPLTREGIRSKIAGNFTIEYETAEVLPFLQDKAVEELGVRFPCPTHVKIIARRKGS